MFNKKTVFILGAGASWHYGYPTGEELVRRVKEKADVIVQTYQSLFEDGRMPSFCPDNFSGEKFYPFVSDVREINNRVTQANPLVIDDFLGRNKDIADVGKLLIAMVLLECEKQTNIRSGKINEKTKEDTGMGDWVRYIVHHLTVDCETPEDLLTNQVTFVTFNYDHSLERRLDEALKNYQWFADRGLSDKFFSPERIYHVYGQLRDFHTTGLSKTQRAFGGVYGKLANEIDHAWDASLALDKHSKPRIRTIAPEEKVAAPEIVKAIADAEHLYFLGYGFDRRNNELLGLGRWQKGATRQAIKFTNFGNLNRISRRVELIYNRQQGALIGPNYFAEFENPLGRLAEPPVHRWTCEKSTKSVYGALAEDFDWPE